MNDVTPVVGRRMLISSWQRGIKFRIPGFVGVVASLSLGAAGIQPGTSSVASRFPHPGRPDPAFARLVTPFGLQGVYRAFTSPRSLTDVMTFYRARQPETAATSWQIETMPALDAFGAAGVFNRGKMARLYRGQMARVARGPIMQEGTVIEAVTLISPYPDAALSRLRSGTLILVTTIPARRGS